MPAGNPTGEFRRARDASQSSSRGTVPGQLDTALLLDPRDTRVPLGVIFWDPATEDLKIDTFDDTPASEIAAILAPYFRGAKIVQR